MIRDGNGSSFDEALKNALQEAKKYNSVNGEFNFSWSLAHVFGSCNSSRKLTSEDSVIVHIEVPK